MSVAPAFVGCSGPGPGDWGRGGMEVDRNAARFDGLVPPYLSKAVVIAVSNCVSWPRKRVASARSGGGCVTCRVSSSWVLEDEGQFEIPHL